MITDYGALIPMILAIGNHEAGGYDEIKTPAPFYLTWFPQAGTGKMDERKSYHVHRIANTTILALDSGLDIYPDDPQQIDLMKRELSAPNYYNRIALYHVPLYPSIRAYDNSVSAAARDAWIPIFDDYSLTVAFENHDHAYKRSKLLKHGKENVNGTLYSGDGCWGVDPNRETSVPWYLERFAAKNYVLLVEVFDEVMNMTALGTDSKGFDSFTVTIKGL